MKSFKHDYDDVPENVSETIDALDYTDINDSLRPYVEPQVPHCDCREGALALGCTSKNLLTNAGMIGFRRVATKPDGTCVYCSHHAFLKAEGHVRRNAGQSYTRFKPKREPKPALVQLWKEADKRKKPKAAKHVIGEYLALIPGKRLV